MKKIVINNLKIDENLVNFIDNEAIPGTNIKSEKFSEVSKLIEFVTYLERWQLDQN